MEPIGTPFLLAIGASQHINKTRIVEAVVIGAILAMGGKFVALPAITEVMTEKISTVNVGVAKLEERMASLENKLEVRRAVRDEQMTGLRKELNEVKVDQARRK